MRLGLAANRLHHLGEEAALFRWLRACEAGIRELDLHLHAVGRTCDAIVAAGMLPGYGGLRRYPYGREGGLMKLVAEVVGLGEPQRTLDGAIYLIDPVDPFLDVSRSGRAQAPVRDPRQAVHHHRRWRARLDRGCAHPGRVCA